MGVLTMFADQLEDGVLQDKSTLLVMFKRLSFVTILSLVQEMIVFQPSLEPIVTATIDVHQLME